ncbi:uncharacterized protein LOC129232793 [Uloborus diversus]|uniref:uncharacterized protein LOC129232793 n=1 Tax=Uloborus diversus TaxID=327109 RepID=UPI0024097A52|nr:uncharacterized protein LOC129232793 [Uloborus diversus]
MSYLIEEANQVFQPLLEKYSKAGDVESLNSIHNLLPDFSLRKMAFNYFYSKAFIESERYEDLLLEMEKNLGHKNKVFSASAFQELLKIPSLEERCLELAERYMELSFDVPVAVLWAHYFVNENFEKAETILKRHGVSFDKIDPSVLRAIRKTENISMGKKYIEILEDRPSVRQRTKERAYGTLLDILVLKEQYDEAASLASRGERMGLPLHKYYFSTLMTLKNALEREGKPVPFTVSSEDSGSISPQAI